MSKHKIAKTKVQLLCPLVTVWVCLILSLILPAVAGASGPEDNGSPNSGRRVTLLSTAVGCATVEAQAVERKPVTVRLEWEGQIERAFLLLSPSGSQAGHSLYVNGQRVGSAPIRPGGQPCQSEFLQEIPIPADLLVNGENVIELTNDANPEDSWTAADVHLEIYGVLSGPPVGALKRAALSSANLGATAVISDSAVLNSSYDGENHTIWYQIPDGYDENSASVPLLAGIHGYSGSGVGVINSPIATEANQRGWLLVAPDMHALSNPNTGKFAFAWPGAQRDIIDAVEYMVDNYNVDKSRIYIAGGSMGGQTTAVMAAKYADVFAAAAPWKGISDLAAWYDELPGSQTVIRKRLRLETGYPDCDPDTDLDTVSGCGTPQSGDSDTLFAYYRRSSLNMPQNIQWIPVKMWHDEEDILVPIHHSQDLRDAVKSRHPTAPLQLIEVPSAGCTDTFKHCLSPDMDELFDYLASFTLNSAPPLSLTVRTDESKSYYWLNVVQSGGDHWSEIEAAYDAVNKTVTASISDTQPLVLGFNLGSTSIPGPVDILQSGMGLPQNQTYLVKEKGGSFFSYQQAYSSGYFTVTLNNTGQYTLSISLPSSNVEVQFIYLPLIKKGN